MQLHHIDSSVILEPENTLKGKYCKKYLRLVGYKYSGKISILALGEILITISKINERNKQYDFLDTFLNTIKERKIEVVVPKEIENISLEIKANYKGWIDYTDRWLIAAAIENNAKTFVTLDTRLIKNKNLQNEFNLLIKHPKDLV